MPARPRRCPEPALFPRPAPDWLRAARAWRAGWPRVSIPYRLRLRNAIARPRCARSACKRAGAALLRDAQRRDHGRTQQSAARWRPRQAATTARMSGNMAPPLWHRRFDGAGTRNTAVAVAPASNLPMIHRDCRLSEWATAGESRSAAYARSPDREPFADVVDRRATASGNEGRDHDAKGEQRQVARCGDFEIVMETAVAGHSTRPCRESRGRAEHPSRSHRPQCRPDGIPVWRAGQACVTRGTRGDAPAAGSFWPEFGPEIADGDFRFGAKCSSSAPPARAPGP